jgi:DNA-directed DNA polymerase III PolC
VALLLTRTHYSLLTAPASPQALCEEAVRLGLAHLVLADANGLYGLYPFARAAGCVGLHGVFGSELVHRGRRLVVIAADRAGYASLCQLISERHGVASPDHGSPDGLDTFDLPRACERHAAGLWFVCGDPRLLPELSVRVPRGRLLVAVPPRGRGGGVPERGATGRDAGRKRPDPAAAWPREQLLSIAADLELSPCAVRDVWFALPTDAALHRLFLAVKWNRAWSPHAEDAPAAAAHLPSPETLHEGFEDCPAALVMAERVLASCSLSFPERAAPIFPPVMLATGETATSETATGALRARVARGLAARYGDAPAARQRAERELEVVERMGFAPYFLAVDAIADLARARGIPFVGRGSAADSLVAHCLGLTDADPLRYGLLFERFLNPGRCDLPDIDLDFCWRRRDELIDAVYAHFGRDRTAMIATYNTCGPRAAYQEAAKAIGLPPAEAARRSKLLPWHARSGHDLAATIAETPGFFRRGADRGDVASSTFLPPEHERLLVRAARQLLQAPRHLGLHPGGIVIAPVPIATLAPLERAAKGVVVTQYDMHFVEGLGLVKIDLLGNRALSIVQDCVAMVRSRGIAVPDLQQVPERDERTVQLLKSGRTLGCFQVESPAMRTLLQQVDADSMDRVIQAIALVRPGPASIGMKDAFARRARGLEPVQAAHPLLAEVFADTLGIMLYQEDVIRAAMAVAGLDAAAGDLLRRQLGKHGEALPAREAEGFVVAGLKRGLPRAAIETVWREMARFAAYSFCKAHAVTYGRLAFRCVFLKSRWPVAFLAALLRNDAGYFAPGVYAEELKRLGGTLLSPCVQIGAGEHELVAEHVVRIGLGAVRGLGERTVQAILTARAAGGPFRDLLDFLRRVQPARDEAEHLIEVGACDAFGVTRPELLWRLSVAMSPAGQRVAERTAAAQRGLLFADAAAPRVVDYPVLRDFDEARRSDAELRLLGFTLGSHPVDVLWRRGQLPELRDCVPCGRLEQYVGRSVRICGYAVAYRGHRNETGGMCFVTIEDGTGIVEATLFPAVHQKVGGVLQGRGPFVVRGSVEERLGGVGLHVHDVVLARVAEAGDW